MQLALCCLPIFLGYGVINVFFKDIAWEFQDFMNNSSGKVSERTEEWEAMALLKGIFFISFSIIIVIGAMLLGVEQ